jgi:hypothetical protein
MRKILVLALFAAVMTTALHAQQTATPVKTPAPARGKAVEPTMPTRTPPAIDARYDPADCNIQITLNIVDKSPAGTQNKTVSMIVANRSNGRVRSTGSTTKPDRSSSDSVLNVDAHPVLFRNGSISTDITLSYQPEWVEDQTKLTSVTQSGTLYLKDGIPMLISQAADPTKGSRSVAIEVTAKIIK